ncbi:hypothetical protein M1563_00340 [Patescibacteria group bacterium]|nr:hypothetical protein [Patescibacteria group bacterium]MCL5409710.1 hypothetical protein [Patescibacteria group bacterium]
MPENKEKQVNIWERVFQARLGLCQLELESFYDPHKNQDPRGRQRLERRLWLAVRRVKQTPSKSYRLTISK